MQISGRKHPDPGRGNKQCKGPEAGVCPAHLSNKKARAEERQELTLLLHSALASGLGIHCRGQGLM